MGYVGYRFGRNLLEICYSALKKSANVKEEDCMAKPDVVRSFVFD